jgi:hypothetical protein
VKSVGVILYFAGKRVAKIPGSYPKHLIGDPLLKTEILHV